MHSALLFLSGKRRQAALCVNDGPPDNNRLSVICTLSNLRFLVDTGATTSIIARRYASSTSPSTDYVVAANGTKIRTFGSTTRSVRLFNVTYRWSFLIADIEQCIIGADFLHHFDLLVDIRRRRLLLAAAHRISEVSIKPTDDADVAALITHFPRLSAPLDASGFRNVGVQHHIETSGRPRWAKPRRLPADKLKLVKDHFKDLIRQGILRPSSSQWASPLHVVPKPNGGIRPCGDYRALNSITAMDQYCIPNIRDCNSALDNATIFTTLDLRSAYHCIPVAEEDIPKTAVTTPFGLYEYVTMPFGLKNAAQTFQRFMDTLLRDHPYAFAYIDDVLIASKSKQEHLRHVRSILQTFQDHGLRINPDKCTWGRPTIQFLGHEISKQGIQPLQEKVEAIVKIPPPPDVSSLRRFLGMVNFYRRYIPHAAEIQAPLNRFLSSTKKKDKTPIQWDEPAEQAFNGLKHALQQATLLAHPKPDATLLLITDASDTAAGAVLHQDVDGNHQPLGFYSKVFTTTQKKYATYDKELQAVFDAVRHFRGDIEGRRLIILTDHKPLTTSMDQNPKTACPRRIRQLSFISQFTTDIRYIKGNDNVVADELSRVEEIVLPNIADDIAAAQGEDTSLAPWASKNPRIRRQPLTPDGPELYCYHENETLKPIIPPALRPRIFRLLHETTHQGVKATCKAIKARYWWPNMTKDITELVQACNKCQQHKVFKNIKAPLTPFSPSEAGEVVHLDVIGPLPPSKGFQYCLTLIDRATSWPECIPIRHIDAATTADTLITHWVSRFGVPKTIVTDQGRNFEAQLFQEVLKQLGITRHRTTAYHPQANGKIERFHRSLKTALKTHLHSEKWVENLPLIMLGLRTASRESDGLSAAQRMFRWSPRLPGDILAPSTPITNGNTIANRLTTAGKTFLPRNALSAKYVFVKTGVPPTGFSPSYLGPYKVIKNDGKVVTIDLGTKTDKISIDRTKPAIVLPDDRQREDSTNGSTQTMTSNRYNLRRPRAVDPGPSQLGLNEVKGPRQAKKRVSFLIDPHPRTGGYKSGSPRAMGITQLSNVKMFKSIFDPLSPEKENVSPWKRYARKPLTPIPPTPRKLNLSKPPLTVASIDKQSGKKIRPASPESLLEIFGDALPASFQLEEPSRPRWRLIPITGIPPIDPRRREFLATLPVESNKSTTDSRPSTGTATQTDRIPVTSRSTQTDEWVPQRNAAYVPTPLPILQELQRLRNEIQQLKQAQQRQPPAWQPPARRRNRRSVPY